MEDAERRRSGAMRADAPMSVMVHHTATSAKAKGDYPTLNVILHGHGSLSGPLANLGLGADLDGLRRHQTAHTDVLSAHAAYDQAMIALVVSLGGTPLPYRALWPTCPSRDPQEQPDPPNDGGYSADLTHP